MNMRGKRASYMFDLMRRGCLMIQLMCVTDSSTVLGLDHNDDRCFNAGLNVCTVYHPCASPDVVGNTGPGHYASQLEQLDLWPQK